MVQRPDEASRVRYPELLCLVPWWKDGKSVNKLNLDGQKTSLDSPPRLRLAGRRLIDSRSPALVFELSAPHDPEPQA